MKKSLFSLLVVLSLSFILKENVIAYATEDITENETSYFQSLETPNPRFYINKDEEEKYREILSRGESELNLLNTSILNELNKQRNYYTDKLDYTYNTERLATINEIIYIFDIMIADYQEYMQLNNSNRDPQPQGGFHLIYSPIVELAIGYLSS